ncbi:hypothetical protein OIU74_012009 [Salix koriyanagi]|uniref:Uncharacterized protein n=1 Tax=Salix koriyanagi TaxID=2511006 RepID=A0A9Q0Q677_9ROSI|nr:hypothetical protein OIU74_012009 [Salix koriyanagi]
MSSQYVVSLLAESRPTETGATSLPSQGRDRDQRRHRVAESGQRQRPAAAPRCRVRAETETGGTIKSDRNFVHSI